MIFLILSQTRNDGIGPRGMVAIGYQMVILKQYSSSLARKGLALMGALAVVACATTFPGLANFVFAIGLEVLMSVALKCVRDRVTLRVP